MTTAESNLPPLRYTVQGHSLTAGELQARQRHAGAPTAAKTGKTKRTPTEAGATHKGWRVLGHPPERLAEFERAHRMRAAPFDAQHWRMNTRKTALNTRPYALEQAAIECAALARKAGWLDVVVEPLTKGAS